MSQENPQIEDVAVQYERVPNIFLLDTSGSMRKETKDQDGNARRKIDQLNDGLQLFFDEISDDIETYESVDVSLVTFGGDVSVERGFQPIKEWEDSGVPQLTAGGTTPMREAILEGLQHLEDYKDHVDNDQDAMGRKRALVWLLTDGRPDNPGGSKWEQVKKQIGNGAAQDAFFINTVGIGQKADMDTLNELVENVSDEDDKEVFHLSDGKFKEFFKIASESARKKSQGASGNPTQKDPNSNS